MLGKFIFAGEFRRSLRTRICLQEYEESLTAAESVEDCWLALRHACQESNFDYVAMQVGGQNFEDQLKPSASPSGRLHIVMSPSEGAVFGHDVNAPGTAMLIAPLAERLREKLDSFALVQTGTRGEFVPPDLLKTNAAAG
jgi:hypothetical protein